MTLEEIQEALSALGITCDKYIFKMGSATISDEDSFIGGYTVITGVGDDGHAILSSDKNLIPVTWSQVAAKNTELKTKFGYVTSRQENYPSIVDQLDTMYHQGFDVWKTEIKAIKDKYPKPE